MFISLYIFLYMNDMDILVKILKALAEPSRLRLLVLCNQGEFSVSELVYILGQSQPRVSRHLKILCDAGLLQKIREGSWMLYRITSETEAAAIAQKILNSLPKNDPVVARDHIRLSSVQAERNKSAADYFRFSAAQWDQIRRLHVEENNVEQVVDSIFKEDSVSKFLDVGTGTGRMLELAGTHAEKVVGIDLSREMLAVARVNIEKTGLKNYSIRQGDMYRLKFPDDEYDVVCIHQVLHFANEPSRAIAESARVLRPGGRLIIVDFLAHKMLELREIFHHSRLGFSDGEFVHWFQRNGLKFTPPTHLPGCQLTIGIWVGIKQFKQ